ncbi:MAG: carbohydrate-binding domain-containing protein [Chloroflexota bacterium]
MKLSKRIIILTACAVFIVMMLVFARPLTLKISQFLSKSEKADANILVIEGWLSYNDLQAAADEFISGKYEHIFITGLKSTTEYYNVYTDGYLIFYTAAHDPGDVRLVEVRARSELDGENAAHFNLWINDSLVADFNADKRRRKYAAAWDGTKVDSVMIQFDNDVVGEFGDRNLFVKEIILNGSTTIPFLNNSTYDISGLDNKSRIINNMNSNAELTAKRLLSMGVDSSKVTAVSGNRVRINRTLTSALALKDWLSKADINVRGINIISSGAHSRRTWMTFDKVLDRPVNVGVIALRDVRHTGPDGVGYVKTMRELIAYIYYSLILIPF